MVVYDCSMGSMGSMYIKTTRKSAAHSVLVLLFGLILTGWAVGCGPVDLVLNPSETLGPATPTAAPAASAAERGPTDAAFEAQHAALPGPMPTMSLGPTPTVNEPKEPAPDMPATPPLMLRPSETPRVNESAELLPGTPAPPPPAPKKATKKKEVRALKRLTPVALQRIADREGILLNRLEVSNSGVARFPLSGKTAYSFKVKEHGNLSSHLVTLDESGQEVNMEQLLAGDRAAYAARYGKLGQGLFGRLESASEDEVIKVGIEVKRRTRYVESLVLERLDALGLPARIVARSYIFLSATPAQIREIETWDEVNLVFQDGKVRRAIE